MDLFDHARKKEIERQAPLAARMRPRSLDEFVGHRFGSGTPQAHIVGPGRLLRRAIQADQLSSVIFYGPPARARRRWRPSSPTPPAAISRRSTRCWPAWPTSAA